MGYTTSDEQILLLNNLLYTGKGPITEFMSDSNEGRTVGEYVEQILSNESSIVDSAEYSTGMTGKEYKDILHAISKDDTLSRLVIQDVYTDGPAGIGGKSALLVDPVSNEAIVTFKGTESTQEWADNFSGISATTGSDGVSTEIQESALKWYQDALKDGGYSSITVAGHSKGANKAKYITIMDDSVNRCVAQDGQGFSDEFVEKYANDIARNQFKITNHNAENDPVNLLLNDVGTTKYYEGTNYNSGTELADHAYRMAENHCTNAIFNFDENGNYVLKQVEQSEGMKELDLLLNSYIRSVPQSDRQKVGAMLAEMMALVDNKDLSGTEKVDKIVDLLTKSNYKDVSSDLVGYILKYKQQYPELMDSIERVMVDIGLEDIVTVTEIIDEITNSDWFYIIGDFIAKHGRLLTKVADVVFYVAKLLGLDVPQDILDFLKKHPELFDFLRDAFKARSEANCDRENGHDIKIDAYDVVGSSSPNSFAVYPENLKKCCDHLETQKQMLEKQHNELLYDVIPDLDYTIRKYVEEPLRICVDKVLKDKTRVERLIVALRQIADKYEQSENNIIAVVS